jgi:glycosyltransferase involved in cell wall biosynthesis
VNVLLLGNYAPDRQQSMLRFAELLRASRAARGLSVGVVAPELTPLARVLSRGGGSAAKWAGYLDKYVFFPRALSRRLRDERTAAERAGTSLVVHVVDHSNAVYVPRHAPEAAAAPGAITIAREAWVVTCHDLLAVRGALGEDTDCPASALGRRLQRAIVAGLGRAHAVACDSTSTRHDLTRLVPAPASQRRRVILLAQNHPYARIDPTEARRRLAEFAGVPWDEPFVLNVGSNLPRKNKPGAVRAFARAASSWPGNLVFCGADVPEPARAEAARLGVEGRVFAVPAPTNAQLEAAYNLAHALLFPSKCEGFGWPVIEAQACGCPVICSDRTSLPEVGGDAALTHALDDEAGMAASILKLTEPAFRADIVARGHANLARFATDGMVDAYGALYEEVLSAAARPR